VILNVVLNHIDLDDVLPQMVVLNIGYLGVLIPLLSQIEEVIGLHLLNDFHQSIVEGGGDVHLLLVLLLEGGEPVDVGGVLGDA
jgi:hypothetical protein